MWRPRHKPTAAKVFRVPAAEVLQPGLPAGRVAGRPQGRVQAAPRGVLLFLLVLIAISVSFRSNVYDGKSRRGGRWRRRRWGSTPAFNPVSRCPFGGRDESRFLTTRLSITLDWKTTPR